mmetsp:Transcript_5704/g.8270  ORF Transcript_5704/g.8270 Transcript_5704/m.8270 type:complete len:327 (+) Transcript_5704:94-1074(+)
MLRLPVSIAFFFFLMPPIFMLFNIALLYQTDDELVIDGNENHYETKNLKKSLEQFHLVTLSPMRKLEFVHITKTGGSTIEKLGSDAGIIWGACHFMNVSDVGCYNPDVPYSAPDYQSYAKTSPWHSPPKILSGTSFFQPYENSDLFTVVRNPYSRILSEYYCPWTGNKSSMKEDRDVMNTWIMERIETVEKVLSDYNSKDKQLRPKEQGPGLNEDPYMLAQKHFINQAEYVYDGKRRVIKNIIHYENMKEEFDELMRKYNLKIKFPGKKEGGVYASKNKKLTFLDLHPETIAVINRFAAPDFEKFGYRMMIEFNESMTDQILVAKP